MNKKEKAAKVSAEIEARQARQMKRDEYLADIKEAQYLGRKPELEKPKRASPLEVSEREEEEAY